MASTESQIAAIALSLTAAAAFALAPDSELLEELKKAKGTSRVLMKKTEASVFTRLQALAVSVSVDDLGQSLVSRASGTCAADAKDSRAEWCDEFVEADLRKNQKAWWVENAGQLWSLRFSREHHAVSDYDFKAKRFALKFVPNWCDIGSFMCLTSQIDRLTNGASMEMVIGAFEQGDKRFTAQIFVPANEDQARTIAGLRETSIPSQRGSAGDLELIFRVSSKTKRVQLRTSAAGEAQLFPFIFVAATPVAFRVTSDDDVVVEYFF